MQTIYDKLRGNRARQLLPRSFYKPHLGGHAPGDLRDAFCEAVDAFEAWEAGAQEPSVDLRDVPVPISTIFGLCWNCSDTLPSLLVDQIADIVDRRPGTYAAAARLLKAEMK